MAIGNITPDSFYSGSRLSGGFEIVRWARQAVVDGASILDIGGCSTRPGSAPIDSESEWARIKYALSAIREVMPDVSLSLDTFRPEIARRALEEFGSMIINDVSGGCEKMYEIVHYWDVPYVWTLRGKLDLPSHYPEMNRLNLVLDPGFGFTGGIEQDYTCLREMHCLSQYGKPILVGISRKSMLYKPLGITPNECLNATQVAQFYALTQGATILRTHDVKESVQTMKLYDLVVSKE